jgi:hypothetical protein
MTSFTHQWKTLSRLYRIMDSISFSGMHSMSRSLHAFTRPLGFRFGIAGTWASPAYAPMETKSIDFAKWHRAEMPRIASRAGKTLPEASKIAKRWNQGGTGSPLYH